MSPYEVLGVPPDAPDEEIARAYRTLAKRWHPDLHPGDDDAARKMGRINRAYEDVKALRRKEEDRGFDVSGSEYYEAYGDPFAPFGDDGRHRWEPRPVRHVSFMSVLLAITLMMLIVRLLLSALFGAAEYAIPPGVPPASGYGYYETIP